ncbi:MAG: peptidase dipeptidylpeptidase domain protein [Gemmatimonadetes bacterium]|nr:peptidase dipeptidylpeptidase domain protein [Gemmatimonadota bacterium]
MRFQSIAAALAGGVASLGAQTPAAQPAPPKSAFDFSIKGIMRGHEMVGRAPSDVRWSADNRWIYFSWNAPGTHEREPLRP